MTLGERRQNVLCIIFASVAVVVMIVLSGCVENRENEQSKLIGTWTSSEYGNLTFSPDGTCSIYGINGTYELKDGRLVITYYYGMFTRETTYIYSFSDDDNTLTLKDIATVTPQVYTKAGTNSTIGG